MPPNWKLFPLSKLHEIEPLKGYMEATTTGRVDQLLTKEVCSSHSQPILEKVRKKLVMAVASLLPQEPHLSAS